MGRSSIENKAEVSRINFGVQQKWPRGLEYPCEGVRCTWNGASTDQYQKIVIRFIIHSYAGHHCPSPPAKRRPQELSHVLLGPK